jgi:PRTRC genetic system protein C
MEFAKPYLADGKDFNNRMSRHKPLKSARFATKVLPKRVLPICYQTRFGPRADRGGSALFNRRSVLPFCLGRTKARSKRSPRSDDFSVRTIYSHQYPELATAAITGPEATGEHLQYSFVRAIGTKG